MSYEVGKFYTTGGVAERLGVSRGTVRNWQAGNILPPGFTTAKGHRRWRKEDIDRFVAASEDRR